MCLPSSFGFALSTTPTALATASGADVASCAVGSCDAVLAPAVVITVMLASVRPATSATSRIDMRDLGSVESGHGSVTSGLVIHLFTVLPPKVNSESIHDDVPCCCGRVI